MIFALALNVAKGVNGIPEVLENLQTNLMLGSLARDEQGTRYQANTDQDQGEQKLGPQSKLGHSRLLLHNPPAAQDATARTCSLLHARFGSGRDWRDPLPVSV